MSTVGARGLGGGALVGRHVGDDEGAGQQVRGEVDGVEADAAGADQQHRVVRPLGAGLLERRERGDARAGVGAGELERQVASRHDVARLRDDDPVAVAAVHPGADDPRLEAEQLLAAPAGVADAAADPGIDDDPLADLDALAARVGAERQDLARHLVAHGEGELHAAVGHADALALAQVVVAVPDVDVGVADPAGADAHHDLAAPRLRVRVVPPLQRPAPVGDLVAVHGPSPPWCRRSFRRLGMVVKARWPPSPAASARLPQAPLPALRARAAAVYRVFAAAPRAITLARARDSTSRDRGCRVPPPWRGPGCSVSRAGKTLRTCLSTSIPSSPGPISSTQQAQAPRRRVRRDPHRAGRQGRQGRVLGSPQPLLPGQEEPQGPLPAPGRRRPGGGDHGARAHAARSTRTCCAT